MKKILLLLLLTVWSSSYAQQFELTPNGFVNSENKNNNYIVLEFPDKTKEELFKEALIYFNKTYVSAKDVISKVDNEIITVSALSPFEVPRNAFHFFENNYSFTLSFKDGKIKIDEPNVRLTRYAGGKKYTLHIFWGKGGLSEINTGIYGKENKLKSPKAKEALELFAQRFVLGFKQGLNPEVQKNDEW